MNKNQVLLWKRLMPVSYSSDFFVEVYFILFSVHYAHLKVNLNKI